MRFLTAYCAQQEGLQVVLTGCERMLQRPIGQEVEALRRLGADIAYLGQEGYPPLRISGKALERRTVEIDHPLSTQFISALLLIGVPVSTDTNSPYITLTREIISAYERYKQMGERSIYMDINKIGDWSAAAFWYEYIALHGGRIRFTNLSDSGQGDQIAIDFFARLGVRTVREEGCFVIEKEIRRGLEGDKEKNKEENKGEREDLNGVPKAVVWDFRTCPDLYPAAAICCERLGVRLIATGTESLPLKESDRIRAVAEHATYADHRIAMALLAADLPCDDTACISKSYPDFVNQLHEVRMALEQEP